jgi:D-hexose-6-phosphate mutarotase
VADINTVRVRGLKGAKYLDKVADFAQKVEAEDDVRISSEVNRVYVDTTATIEIHDPTLRRKIIVEKHGSISTVLWNPWITQAQQMPDLANDEYQRMLCVESGNVGPNQIKLPPGESSTLVVKIRSEQLAGD